MVRATLFCSAKSASWSMAKTSMATFSHLASVALPALPGAIKTFSTRGSCATFHAKACSRPPLPIIKIFIENGPQKSKLVAEVTHAGEYHGNVSFICCGDHFFVTHGAAGLDYCTNTHFGGVI